MNEPRVVESIANECQSLGRAHESSSDRAEQLIACLEGEISKRDETIARIEPQLNRAIQANYDLRAELAASKAKVPVTNDESGLEAWAAGKFGVGGAFRGELCGNTDWALARLVWSAALAYAAPVSEAKAQGVTDEQAAFEAAVAAVNERGWSTSTDLARQIWNAARLSAAPAAPAADAGIVDMYRHLQKVTPYRFKKIQDASITDGGDVMYFHKDRFDAALLADMAAHCAAKGVV